MDVWNRLLANLTEAVLVVEILQVLVEWPHRGVHLYLCSSNSICRRRVGMRSVRRGLGWCFRYSKGSAFGLRPRWPGGKGEGDYNDTEREIKAKRD